MPINQNALGAETPWTQVVVTQRQIDSLCSCLEDYNPLFLDDEIASQSGNAGIVAPPTLINCFRDFKTTLVLSETEVDLPLLLHGEQVIHYFKPVRPGETVWHKIKVVDAGRKKTKPIKLEEFDAEAAWWGKESDGFNTRVENQYAWKVSIEDIKARHYNLDCKNPHIGKQEIYDPEELLAQYATMQNEMAVLRNQLKTILKKSLDTGQ